MLTRSGRPLPSEICEIIYSHVERRDLVHVLRVCRRLFEVTAPYVWKKVDLAPVVRVLTGVCYVPRAKDGTFEMTAYADALVKGAPGRLHIYAKHVKCLTISHNDFGGNVPTVKLSRFSISSYASSHPGPVLPRLETLSVSFDIMSELNIREVESWVDIMAPGTLDKLKFRTGRLSDTDLVGPLLLKFPKLTKFEYRLSQMGKRDSWGFVHRRKPPPALDNLDFECFALDQHGMEWLSSIHRLRTLKLSFYSDSTPREDLSDPMGTKYPNAFTGLRNFSVHLGSPNWEVAMQIWRSPLVTNLTRVIITTFGKIGTNNTLTGQFLSLLARSSPSLYHLEIDEGGLEYAENPKLPVAVLTILAPLSLKVIKIGRVITGDEDQDILGKISALWPRLDELYLPGTTVEPRELARLPIFFPRLQQLHVRIPMQKRSSMPLSSTYGDYKLPSANSDTERVWGRPVIVVDISPFESQYRLMAGLGPDEKEEGLVGFNTEDQDFLAKTLVAVSSDVHIAKSFVALFQPYLRERLDYYSKADVGGLGL